MARKTATKSANPIQPEKPVEVKATKPRASKATSASKSTSSPAAAPVELTQDLIAERAYLIWLTRGKPQGQDESIWLAAEAELRSETAS